MNKFIEILKDVFNYINKNSFLATLIGIIVGWILNFISTAYFNRKSENRKQKEKLENEKKKNFENKPELYIEKEDNNLDISMEIFITPFNIKYDENNNYEIIYPKGIKNKNKHDFKDVIIKNIGKSDIECLDIVSTNKKSIVLTDYSFLETLVDNKSVWYSCCYDRKIRVGDKIKIRIYFLKNNIPCMMFSSTLAFLFEDQNHIFWEQPYFYERDNIYSPHNISYKEFRNSANADDAYDCFENPSLW